MNIFHKLFLIPEEQLKEMGMSITEFALRSKKSEKTIIAIIKEESVIAHEMAIKFENVTQIGANFWMRHQQAMMSFKPGKLL